MDINKEREAFEIAYHATHSPIIKRPYPILKDGDYQYLEIDQAWKLWQAKTQVPEGFVLVPKKPTEKMLKAIYDNKNSTANAYKAMIEAQEQSNA